MYDKQETNYEVMHTLLVLGLEGDFQRKCTVQRRNKKVYHKAEILQVDQ